MTQKVFISVGEASGDVLAGELVSAYKSCIPNAQFFGVAGHAMKKQGVHSILDVEHLSVMGFFEVLKQVRFLFRVESMILSEIERQEPDVAILVDYPGLHFRLAPKIRSLGVKVVQYVAPKVWAWGEKRVHRLRTDFDLVIGILPFENEFFERYGVNYHYVGSPHKARIDAVEPLLHSAQTCVAILPGSRKSEIDRLLGDIAQVVKDLKANIAGVQFILPVADSLNFDTVAAMLEGFFNTTRTRANSSEAFQVGPITLIKGKSLEVLKRADVALVASGTATLECALLQKPMVVLYKISPLSYWLAKKKVKLTYFSLVNLMLGEPLVPEFIQHYDTIKVGATLQSLLNPSNVERKRQVSRFQELYTRLTPNAEINAVARIQEILK